MLVFGEEKDWKELLSEDMQAELAELIERAKKHRGAYMQADDVKVAQLWSALAEISKEIKDIKRRISRLESLARGFVEAAEEAKRQAIRDKVSEFFKPKTAREREKVERIVDTLMQF